MSSPPQLARYQVALLRPAGQYDDFDEESRERIFREHLAYTLGNVASGAQLAAGPVPDGPAEDETICGLGVYQQDSLDEVRQLLGTGTLRLRHDFPDQAGWPGSTRIRG